MLEHDTFKMIDSRLVLIPARAIFLWSSEEMAVEWQARDSQGSAFDGLLGSDAPDRRAC